MQEERPYIEKTFTQWRKFKIFIDKSKHEWIYRNQGNSLWTLTTSLERSNNKEPIERIASIENQIVEEFKRAAKHYLPKKFLPTTLTEWLALIQHYGSPTRLIDFTRSPYVASYFAFEDESIDCEFVSIWVVNLIAF